MLALSPVEAIGPAWRRMRAILLEPFKLGHFLKLCLVALLALCGGGFNFNFNHSHGMDAAHALPGPAASVLVITSLIFGTMGAIVGLVLFYAGSRMQFVMFEMVATKYATIAPMWNRYGRVTWRWIGLKVIFMTIMVCVLVISAIPLIVHVLPLVRAGENVRSMLNLHFVLGLIGPIALIVLAAMVWAVVYMLLLDFVLPVMAVENAGIGESVRRAAGILRTEPGMLVGYVLMTLVLCIAMGFASMVGMLLVMAATAIPLGLIGAGLWFGLHTHGIGAMVLMGFGFALEALVALAVLAVCYLGVVGVTAIFRQAYSQYFYGGRYQPLGDILEPPPIPEPAD